MVRHRRRIAERLRLRPLGGVRRQRCVLVVDLRGERIRDQRPRADQRITRRALPIELATVAIAGVVVVRGVRHEAHAVGIDQGRALAGSRAVERRARRCVHRLDVAAVDRDPRHPVALGARDQRRRRVLVLAAHRLRPTVAVHDEDARQLVHRCDVHRLVHFAFLGAAVTERDHRHAAVTEELRAPRAADAVAAMVRLRSLLREHVQGARPEMRVRLPPVGVRIGRPRKEAEHHVARRHPEHDQRGEIAIVRRQPIDPGPHRHRIPGPDRLVAAARHREMRAARARQPPHPFVQRPGE
jgi:hypothetical protein